MAENVSGMLYDGIASVDAGMDSGLPPNRIAPNQIAWGLNTTVRGGFITQRPGFLKRDLQFLDADGAEDATVKANFETERFQGASYYRIGNRGYIMVMIGGRLFRIDVEDGYKVQDVSIAGDLNPSVRWRVWMTQAEDFLIVQDGQSRALIYDGGSARRASGTEVPMGTAMAYGMGRLIVGRGREYFASDLVYGSSGTPEYGLRDAVLKFTEDTYLSEGGSFALPLQAGEINGMTFLANLDTSLGQGELVVFSRDAVFTTRLPFDRTTWKEIEGMQRIAQVKNGSASDAIVAVNGDLFYRSSDGIRSLILAIRQFGQWANRPVSREVNRALGSDSDNLLEHSSGVLFDNRLLMTNKAHLTDRVVYHTGIIALDFDVLSSMRGSAPPAYDGVWSGLNVAKLVTGQFGATDRCFAIHYDTDLEVFQLWEVTKDGLYDNDGNDQVTWNFETRSFDFNRPLNQKELVSGELWVDQLRETVAFQTYYRPDQAHLWQSWHGWSECATVELCEPASGCMSFETRQPQYRSKLGLPKPDYACNDNTDTPMNLGWEFQVKVSVTGPCRVRQMRIKAEEKDEPIFAGCAASTSCSSVVECNAEEY